MNINSNLKCVVAGEIVATQNAYSVINPATEEEIACVGIPDDNLIDKAVDAAQQAFNTYRKSSIPFRQTVLFNLARILKDNADHLGQLITIEQGKPYAEAQSEVSLCHDFIHAYAKLAQDAKVFVDADDQYVEQFYAPLGVVAGITPWNFPLATAIMKIGPALIAGNSVIIKASPTTPLAVLQFGALCVDVIPAGLLQVLSDDETVGPKLVEHAGIRKVSFTGSTKSGRKVMASAARQLKRVTLELGGNDAAVLCRDIDPHSVAKQVYAVAFMNCGQICTTVKRLFVHEALYKDVCKALVRCANETVVGNGMDQTVTMGPVQNKLQYEKVRALFELSSRNGNVLAGGSLPDGPGFFLPPTIVTDVDDDSALVEEEQFGPILPVLRFKNEQDVIQRVNSTEFGLSASVWSTDTVRAREMAREIDAGVVWINKHLDLNPEYPLSPCKQSGIGTEFGAEGIREFMQSRLIDQ